MTGADVQVDRARISATQAGVWAWGMNGLVTNSEIRPLGGANGITAASSGGADASMAIRNVTIVGDGGGSTGVWAVNNTGHTVTASVDNTVIGGVKRAFARDGGAVGAANLGVEYSDFDPSGLSSNGLGSFVMGDGNISADPLFSSTLDFHPLAGSPLVDAGDPVSFSDALDLDGHPRVLAGRRDIGAYETPPAAATPAAETSPAASPAATTTVDPGAAPRDTAAPSIAGLKIAPARFTARHGARIGFKLSERASVVVAIKRQGAHRSRLTNVATLRHSEPAGSSRIAIRRRVGRVTLTPGRYVAVVSAADAAGNRSRSYRRGFQIIAG
jgi:hypothetical protein